MTGINIQYPISQLILEGKKTIETRTYPIPNKYKGVEMAIIETPGKVGTFNSRIVGTIVFDNCFKYSNKKVFDQDKDKHFVSEDSDWRWNDEKPKWGWEISKVTVFEKPIIAPANKGIKYTLNIQLEI